MGLKTLAEKQISVEGRIIKLPEPFMVIATQNPVEFMGTYPLPEAQMDRFMMCLSIGYPGEEEEVRLLQNVIEGKTVEQADSICKAEDITKMMEEVLAVKVSDGLIKYIQEMVELTRQETSFVLGASPRAMISILRASQARAYLQGRDFVKPDDVKKVALPCLHHRISLTSEAKIRKENLDKKLEAIVVKAKVPMN